MEVAMDREIVLGKKEENKCQLRKSALRKCIQMTKKHNPLMLQEQ